MISQRRREGEEEFWSAKRIKAEVRGIKPLLDFQIVNGKPHKVAAECDLFSPGLSHPILVKPPTKTRTEARAKWHRKLIDSIFLSEQSLTVEK